MNHLKEILAAKNAKHVNIKTRKYFSLLCVDVHGRTNVAGAWMRICPGMDCSRVMQEQLPRSDLCVFRGQVFKFTTPDRAIVEQRCRCIMLSL